MATNTPFFEAISAVGLLKERKRAGWIPRGVKNVESVAEHSYRSGFMAHLLAPPGYDKDKMFKMAMIHDFTDAFERDITPVDGITMEEKRKLERASMAKFLQLLPVETQHEYYELWEEFEEQKTKEAQFVKEVQTLEMLFQALEYQLSGNFTEDLTEFLEYERNNRKDIKHPALIPYFDEIDKRWPKDAKKRFDASKYKYYY